MKAYPPKTHSVTDTALIKVIMSLLRFRGRRRRFHITIQEVSKNWRHV